MIKSTKDQQVQKTICLTGGGTAGHVTPHFALIPEMKRLGWHVVYIGSKGIEKSLVEGQNIPFFEIAAGKLRRYLSWQNVTDIFRTMAGFVQAYQHLSKIKPQLIFSKGGFVAVPVAFAGWLHGIPVVSHESDVSPGLANRLIGFLAKKIMFSFPETKTFIRDGQKKGLWVGAPVRQDLFTGDKNRALALCGFDKNFDPLSIPTLLVMGGSQGALRINQALQEILPTLVEKMQVIHLTGKGKGLEFKHPRYKSFEFVTTEFKDLLALATHVVSRAGSNSIFELLALSKPMLLIPLELGSRGDQILNARSFQQQGWAITLRDKDLAPEELQKAIGTLIEQGPSLILRQKAQDPNLAIQNMIKALKQTMDDQA
jgi:UDP-N-acetylglucosamine--N-acetylmuramyl-(pentapeptide) pyrophosphoryl-undecaprenol N-acetylglucosamine transferase